MTVGLLSFAAAAAAISSPVPTILPSITDDAGGSWIYMGCAVDSGNNRVLPNLLGEATTPEICANLAKNAGYSIFGLENGAPVIVSDSECSMACASDPTVLCGDGWRLDLYAWNGVSTTSPTVPTISPSVPTILPSIADIAAGGSWIYMGCAVDSGNNRVLPSLLGDATTPENCANLAKNAGYSIFGLEHGWECWAYSHYAAGTPVIVSDSECSMACASDPTVLCGDGWRLDLYVWNGVSTISPSVSTISPPVPTISPSIAGGISSGATAAIAAAVLVTIAAAGIILFFVVRSRRRSVKDAENPVPGSATIGNLEGGYVEGPPPAVTGPINGRSFVVVDGQGGALRPTGRSPCGPADESPQPPVPPTRWGNPATADQESTLQAAHPQTALPPEYTMTKPEATFIGDPVHGSSSSRLTLPAPAQDAEESKLFGNSTTASTAASAASVAGQTAHGTSSDHSDFSRSISVAGQVNLPAYDGLSTAEGHLPAWREKQRRT
ncbi:hypothetical protein HK405_012324 [Cladochytrium tenue]|nr:hypothetical protein HK405_012324 [Cladochytrium tenue]